MTCNLLILGNGPGVTSGESTGENRERYGEDLECLYKRKGIPKDSLLFFGAGNGIRKLKRLNTRRP